MGDLRNCPYCGKVFVKIAKNMCPDCVEKEEQEYEEVRLFLKDNPGAQVIEIHEATGIEENKILKWMREGRIDLTDDSGTALTCQRCGQKISTGNLCTKCSQALASQMMKTISGAKPQAKEEDDQPKEQKRGMFTADRNRGDD